MSDERLGSGPNGLPLDHYFCANVNQENRKFCCNIGDNFHCDTCGLAGYCSQDCQNEHWPHHRNTCEQSPFRNETWNPKWVTENREPDFAEKGFGNVRMGVGYWHCWGNTPAFDLINLASNEGLTCRQQGLRLVFAASGDIRSLVETLACVPEEYCMPLEVVFNDRDPVTVARNLLMLSLLLREGERAIDTVIGLWYSAALPNEQCTNLVGPIIEEYLLPLKDNGSRKITFGLSSIELEKTTPLDDMIRMWGQKLDIPEAVRQRSLIMDDQYLDDYLDRHFVALGEFERQAVARFRSTGIFLPHESFSAHFTQPNKFLFDPNRGWMLGYSSDPTEGWDMTEVEQFGDIMKLPQNDLYGRLYFYIRDRMSKMLVTIRRIPVKIRLFNKKSHDLAAAFKHQKLQFDRVDVSNISDERYIGIQRVLNDWAPLLNESNPNSAIVTHFLSWNNGPTVDGSETDNLELIQKARVALGLENNHQRFPLAAQTYWMQIAKSAFFDQSKMFETYLETVLKRKPKNVERRMKHKIVPHKPMYPIKSPIDAVLDCMGEKKQYVALRWSISPLARFVEWGFAKS